MSLSIGSVNVDLSAANVVESEQISLRFDPTKIVPMFVTPEMFEEIHINLGMAKIIEAMPNRLTDAKRYHKWLREAGQTAGQVLHKIATSPQLTEDGILIRFNAAPAEPAEKEAVEEVAEPAAQPTGQQGTATVNKTKNPKPTPKKRT